MDIFDQKKELFGELQNACSFLQTSGFQLDVADRLEFYGATGYYYAGRRDWATLTPASVIGKADVNTFKGPQHMLQLRIEDALWEEQTMDMLKQVTEKAFADNRLRLSCQHFETFEECWEACGKPDFQSLVLRANAFAGRMKNKTFVNIYNDHSGQEMTGKVSLSMGDYIRASLRFNISETEHDTGQFVVGICATLAAGLRVCVLNTDPEPIRAPWDWSPVDFDSVSIPMHTTVCVRTPALEILECGNGVMRVDLQKNDPFRVAMGTFHRNAGVPAWDGSISCGRFAVPGTIVVASLTSVQSSTGIVWETTTVHFAQRSTARPKPRILEGVETEKRHLDSRDSCTASQTKRQCI